MTLTFNPNASVQNQDDGVLNASLSASAATCTISPVKKWVGGVYVTGGFDTSAGFVKIIDSTGRYEFASYSSLSIDANNITTLSGMTRGLSPSVSTITGGTGLVFDANTRIYVCDYGYMWNYMMNLDGAQTVTGAKTFSGGVTFGGTTKALVLPQVTTTQRNAMSPTEGWVVEDTTLKQIYAYLNGGWVSLGSSTVTFPIGPTQGGTGLSTIAKGAIPVSSATDTIVALAPNTSSTVKKYVQSLGDGAAGLVPTLSQVDLVAGVTGNLPVTNLNSGTGASISTAWRGDGTWGTPPSTMKLVSYIKADSTTLTNPTSDTAFDNQSYTVLANTLNATTGLEFYFSGTGVRGASSTVTFDLYLDSTLLAGSFSAPAATDTPFTWRAWGTIFGTATAGSSVLVRTSMNVMIGKTDNSIVAQLVPGEDSQTQSTNADHALTLKTKFGTSNASHTIILKNGWVKQVSTVAF